jgi:hypothetical protein
MNKQIFKFFAVCLVNLSPMLMANFADMDKNIKLRVAAFFPIEDRVRDIYGSTQPSYQIESTVGINDFTFAWLNVDWMSKNGHSEHLKNFTSMRMLSISSGASLLGQVREDIKIYLGCGYSLSCLSIHNRHTLKHRHQKKYISGLQVKSGVLYTVSCDYFVEFFVDYLYQARQFKSRISLGGFKVGGGLGYHF